MERMASKVEGAIIQTLKLKNRKAYTFIEVIMSLLLIVLLASIFMNIQYNRRVIEKKTIKEFEKTIRNELQYRQTQ